MLRAFIGIFLLTVIVEGAIRKWVLPEYSNQIFAIKDFILLAAFVAYIAQRPKRIPKASSLAIWIFWALMVIGFGAIGSFSLESLIGMRYYLAPLPLLVIVPELIRNPGDLDRAAAWAVRLAIPIGILGIVQYLSPSESRLNSYAWSTEEIGTTFGIGNSLSPDRARVTGTFSYISTYASFLSAVWVFAWISLLHSQRWSGRLLAGSSLILIAFNMAMNGSRSLLVIAAVSGIPFAIALVRQLGSFRSQVLFAVIVIATMYAGTNIFEPFVLTADRGDDQEAFERILGALFAPYVTLSIIDVIGNGIGSTFGGFELLGIRASTGFDEINLDRVGIELGIIGYSFLLVIKVLMVAKTLRAYLREPPGSLRHWALAALLIQVSTVWQIPFYNAVAAVFYFGAIGFIYWLEGEQRRRAGAPRSAPVEFRAGTPVPARQWR